MRRESKEVARLLVMGFHDILTGVTSYSNSCFASSIEEPYLNLFRCVYASTRIGGDLADVHK